MKSFVWPKDGFKNFFAFTITIILLYMIYSKPELRDVSIAILMLIIKHYYDNNTGNAKKDEAIASMASSIPNAENK